MSGQTLWEVLAMAHMYQMLEILRDHGECMQSFITERTGENDSRASAKLEMLRDNGVVSSRFGESANTNHNATYWSLTSKGTALMMSMAVSDKVWKGEITLEDLEGPQ